MMPLSCFLVSPQEVLLVPAQKAVGARHSPGDPIVSWTPMAPLGAVVFEYDKEPRYTSTLRGEDL